MSEGASRHLSNANVSEAGFSGQGRQDRQAAFRFLRFAKHFGCDASWLVADDINFVFQFDTQGLAHVRIKDFGGAVGGDTGERDGRHDGTRNDDG